MIVNTFTVVFCYHSRNMQLFQKAKREAWKKESVEWYRIVEETSVANQWFSFIYQLVFLFQAV